jgi:hypothetical protein
VKEDFSADPEAQYNSHEQAVLQMLAYSKDRLQRDLQSAKSEDEIERHTQSQEIISHVAKITPKPHIQVTIDEEKNLSQTRLSQSAFLTAPSRTPPPSKDVVASHSTTSVSSTQHYVTNVINSIDIESQPVQPIASLRSSTLLSQSQQSKENISLEQTNTKRKSTGLWGSAKDTLLLFEDETMENL